MRFHVVALPHTLTTREFSPCAYTQKVRNFCRMMRSLGHTVFHYGTEGSEADCDEHISIISQEQHQRWWGDVNWRQTQFRLDWDSNKDYWKESNGNAIGAIFKRIQPKDFICLIAGNCQKPIADAFPNHHSVEYGIGYEGVFSRFRVFESYAWMHTLYGKLQQWGQCYDEVIPNYYDPNDFPFSAEKDNYFLFMGRLIRSKGPHIASEMCERLGARLLIAGQGADEVHPDHLVADGMALRGEYVGVVDAQERGRLMSRARAVILPTQYVGPFEGVTVEAQLCGTPVITTDWGCYAETVLDGVTGFRTRTLGEMVWAGQQATKLDPHTIRDWASQYTLDVVKYRYQDYFERLMGLWGKGWYDLGYTGQTKREQGGFSRALPVTPAEAAAPEVLKVARESAPEEHPLFWKNAQEYEGDFWNGILRRCTLTFGEETKQLVYAQSMGLYNGVPGPNPTVLCGGRSVLDVGGGPTSLLLKISDFRRAKVIDPLKYPDWVLQRYRSIGIEFQQVPAEEMVESGWDVVLFYNVLQHTMNPEEVVRRAVAAGKELHAFEWVNIPKSEGHPHTLTPEQLDAWTGLKGTVRTFVGEGGCFGEAWFV